MGIVLNFVEKWKSHSKNYSETLLAFMRVQFSYYWNGLQLLCGLKWWIKLTATQPIPVWLKYNKYLSCHWESYCSQAQLPPYLLPGFIWKSQLNMCYQKPRLQLWWQNVSGIKWNFWRLSQLNIFISSFNYIWIKKEKKITTLCYYTLCSQLNILKRGHFG